MTRAMERMQVTGVRNDAGTTDGGGATTWSATVRLAAMLSVIAALVAATLATVADISTTAVVLMVIVIGFAASWVHSGRTLS